MKKIFLVLIMFVLCLSAGAITEKEYWSLFEEAMKLPLCQVSEDSSKIIKEQYSSSMRAMTNLHNIAPCEALPFLFSKLEDNALSNKMITIYCNDGILTNCLGYYLKKEIFIATKLFFGYKSLGHIAFPWLTGKHGDLIIPSTSFHCFWWYEGRKYMPKIWESWYECWKTENERECPRKFVLRMLSDEISDLGYFAFPYLAEKINAGDKTLCSIYPNIDIVKLMRNEGWKYQLPECEGLFVCKDRLKGDVLKKLNFRRMTKWQQNADNYYKNYHVRDTKYWYWRLPGKDDVSFEEIFDLKYNNR